MDQQRRIAIYGGTFDPVHYGHLAVAKNAVELFEITELLLVPARRAPHKLEQEVTSPLHRYAMLVLATLDDPVLTVSTFELDSADRRYTIETLAHFQTLYGNSAELFFVMGADSWAEITTWREWQRLIRAVNHIVVTRPGYEIRLDQEGLPEESVVDVRGWDRVRVSRLLEESKEVPRVYITDVAMVDVAATEIREAARAALSEELKELVPAPVADYIIKYKVYSNSNET